MNTFKDRVVVITGAASGIGRALALGFFAEGCHLALSDLQLENLQALAPLLQSKNQKVSFDALNVADREAFEAYAAQVIQTHGRVDIVVNNAGVTVLDSAEQISYSDFEWLMSIDFWGVVYGSKAFLPWLKQSPEGRLVNISSIFGLIGFPGQSAYNAAKFAVKGFTESLNQEMKLEKSRLRAVTVHPGGIRTNIAKSARFSARPAAWSGSQQQITEAFQQKLARTSPEKAAATIIRGLRQNKTRILIGADAYLVDWLQRLWPTAYQSVICLGHRRMAQNHSPD